MQVYVRCVCSYYLPAGINTGRKSNVVHILTRCTKSASKIVINFTFLFVDNFMHEHLYAFVLGFSVKYSMLTIFSNNFFNQMTCLSPFQRNADLVFFNSL